MGLLKLLFSNRAKRDDDDLADGPHSDNDHFALRDREATRLGGSKQREEDRDNFEEMRREQGN